MLGLNAVEILLHIVNIVALFFIIRWLLYKPIMKFLGNRSATIQRQVDEATKKHAEAEQQKAKYDEMVENAQEMAQQLINQGKEVADRQARTIIEGAEAQAKELRERAERQIEEQKQQAVLDMRQDITQMAIQIAEKVLEREVSYEDNKSIIDDFFEKVG
ncbi:MAG: F0F1 ATP synthase subunit B [Christensenellaceae bacterium]|jgi:F-type H+-transporting ATPase subunit b